MVDYSHIIYAHLQVIIVIPKHVTTMQSCCLELSNNKQNNPYMFKIGRSFYSNGCDLHLAECVQQKWKV